MKCLVLRFSSIGDIVLTTPVLRAFKKKYPEGELHYFTKKKFAFLLEANPYVDKIWAMEEHLGVHVAALRKEQYDCVFDLHHNLRTWGLKIRLGRPSYTFDKRNVLKWLLVRFKREFSPVKHVVDRYLEVVEKIGVLPDGAGLDYVIPADQKVSVSALPPSHQQGFVAVAIGGTYATKRLPVDRLIALCREIQWPVVLLGGGSVDEEVSKEIEVALGEQVYNGCGKFSIHQSASIIQQAQVIVTHDTGMMHIAAAFHKKIISIWGNTSPAFGMDPYRAHPDSKIFEVANLSCRPCSKLGFNACPEKHFKCMRQHNIPGIAQYINTLNA